jgi:hypothetical protein
MPKYKPMPPLERLNELLEIVEISPDKYGEWSGLVWKVNRSRTAKAGKVAGNLKVHHSRRDKFYWEITIEGKSYYVARVVYYMVHNEDPKDIQIDHIDRNPYNNNVYNLRLDINGDIQIANQSTRRSNTSGVPNVSWHKRLKKWQAYLCVMGQRTLFVRLKQLALFIILIQSIILAKKVEIFPT